MTVSTYFIIGLLRGGQLFQESWFFVLYLYVRLYFLLTLQLNYFKMTSCWTDVNHWALSSDNSDEKCYPPEPADNKINANRHILIKKHIK